MEHRRPDIQFIQLDERNALLFNERNTALILACVREATADSAKRAGIYAALAKRLFIDAEKMNLAVIKYVDRLKRERSRPGPPAGGNAGKRPPEKREGLDEKILLAALCRKVGHRYVTIALSHMRGYRECERCGRHESKYSI